MISNYFRQSNAADILVQSGLILSAAKKSMTVNGNGKPTETDLLAAGKHAGLNQSDCVKELAAIKEIIERK